MQYGKLLNDKIKHLCYTTGWTVQRAFNDLRGDSRILSYCSIPDDATTDLNSPSHSTPLLSARNYNPSQECLRIVVIKVERLLREEGVEADVRIHKSISSVTGATYTKLQVVIPLCENP